MDKWIVLFVALALGVAIVQGYGKGNYYGGGGGGAYSRWSSYSNYGTPSRYYTYSQPFRYYSYSAPSSYYRYTYPTRGSYRYYSSGPTRYSSSNSYSAAAVDVAEESGQVGGGQGAGKYVGGAYRVDYDPVYQATKGR